MASHPELCFKSCRVQKSPRTTSTPYLQGGAFARSAARPGAIWRAALSVGVISACSQAGDGAVGPANRGDSSGAVLAEQLADCAAASPQDSPRSILEAVAQVNALPKPLTLPCFIATLPRPLAVQASQSVFSAQPALGRRSPRMFIFSDPLLMTIVPDGSGSHLLEFGQRHSETSSIKGELEFPVLGALRDEDAFERLIYMDRFTTCSACHAGEVPAEDIAFTKAFVSQALRPASSERVGLAEMLAEARACNVEAEPERCAMLQAVFGAGDVVDHDFPDSVATFY